jgi:hypothetical protein
MVFLKMTERCTWRRLCRSVRSSQETSSTDFLQLVAALPTKSKTRVELTYAFLGELWYVLLPKTSSHMCFATEKTSNSGRSSSILPATAHQTLKTQNLLCINRNTLEHPPQSYLGDDFKYRSADGSNNSYIFPKLGAANTPYARSVNPLTVQPGAYPDPGLIFDSVMARESFTENPNKVSSIFFNWASLVIHGKCIHNSSVPSHKIALLDQRAMEMWLTNYRPIPD